ncbi:hypothetical protein NQ315_008259 [Exocentrus adspersus]|uniref:Uncharacterized protein n=1 Tax=Exocentrus adspersus TaxID=1586481 RepID=A0AAV8VM78_9CUCU|nr:hypothetical protein NQ315_008259 [Exocentrus adspersus]
MLDACMQNAWQLHKKSKGTLPQLEFRREIVKSYLKSFGTQPKGAGRTSTSTSSVTLNRVSDDLRYDKRDHFVVRIPQNKRRRCAGEGCASSGRTMVNLPEQYRPIRSQTTHLVTQAKIDERLETFWKVEELPGCTNYSREEMQ